MFNNANVDKEMANLVLREAKRGAYWKGYAGGLLLGSIGTLILVGMSVTKQNKRKENDVFE